MLQTPTATSDGRSRRGIVGRPHLDVPAAAGIEFHDGEPVLAKDVVASINRWVASDQMGQMIKSIENELVAIDDRTFPPMTYPQNSCANNIDMNG
jgi:hypothetical protein